MGGEGAILCNGGMVESNGAFLHTDVESVDCDIKNIEMYLSSGDIQIVELESGRQGLMDDEACTFDALDLEVSPEGIFVVSGCGNA